MSSGFKDGLNKLVCGSSEITDTPRDVTYIIQTLLTIEMTATCTLISERGFEVSFNKFLLDVIGQHNINKFIISYFQIDVDDDNTDAYDINSVMHTHKPEMKSIEIFRIFALDDKYITFCEVNVT